jgi:acetyl-CoA acetyltransferase
MTIKTTCPAIVGIGQTDYESESSLDPGELAMTAILRAIDDAGLAPSDVDGVVRYSIDSSISVEMIASSLGSHDITFWAEIPHGGGASCGTVLTAANAVAAGEARYVICFRAFTPEDFGKRARYNSSTLFARGAGVKQLLRENGWDQMVSTFALQCQRHMFEYGTSEKDLANIVTSVRYHAGRNPRALLGELSLDDYFDSPCVSSPLRLEDCFVLPCYGAAAVIVACPAEVEIEHAPAYIRTAVMAMGNSAVPYWEMWPLRTTAITETPAAAAAQRLYERSGLSPRNIQVAELYDCYSYTLLVQLEDYRFCAKGEVGEFVADGGIRLGGHLPVNTHGGSLGEAYIHGFNHIIEGARQIRGTSTSQVADVEHVLVSGGTPSATSALLLGVEER